MNTRSSCKLFNPSPLSKKRLFAHHYYACLCKKSLSHLVHMKNFGKSHRPGSRSDMACHTQRQWIHPDFKLRKCFMKLIQPFLCLLAVSCVSCIQIQIFPSQSPNSEVRISLIVLIIVFFALFHPLDFANASSFSPLRRRTGFRFRTVPIAAAAGVSLPPFFRYFKVSTVI